KQSSVATSLDEAEYVVAAGCSARVLWIKSQSADYDVFNDKFWNSISVKRSGDVTRLQALVDKKKIVISEAVIRKILQLNDAEGVVCLPNEQIFAGLAQMGYEKPNSRNEFSTTMASAVICLSKGQRFNFSKYIFDSLVRNVDNNSKFYMYPRFIQLIIQAQVGDLSTHTTHFISPVLTQKVFANMRRVGKGFSGVETPLFEEDVAEDVAYMATPSPPPHGYPSPPQEPASPPQQPHVTPPVPTQGKAFPASFQQVLDTCSALFRHVEHLEHDKVAQRLEIIKLKARVKKLEKTDKVKSSKFRRLRKVGASRQVESSDDIEDEVVEVVTTAKLITEVVTAAASQVSSTSTTIPAANASIPAAKPSIHAAALIVVAAYTRRRKGVIIRDPKEELSLKTSAETPKIELDAEYARKLHKEINKDVAVFNKDIDWDAAMDHVNQKSSTNPQYRKRYQGMKKRPQTESEACKNIMIYLKNTAGYKMDFFKGMSYADICLIFQVRFDENMRFLFKSREEMEEEDEEIIKSINETPAQKAAKRRKLNEVAQETEALKKHLEIVHDEDDDVFTEVTPLRRKVSVVYYEIVMINNKPRYKIIRADDTHQLYISFITLLKNLDREDLEDLWRIMKDRFSTSKPTNFSDNYLLSTLKTMFKKTDRQDAIWRNQQSVYGQALVKS
nr:hypothetical protein [Tanacetum cinerariifolium]